MFLLLNAFKFIGGSKILIYIFIGFISIGSLGITYYTWKSSIKKQALMEYNQKQLEQLLEDKEEYIRIQKALVEEQEIEKKKLTEENEKLNIKINEINDFLDSVEAKKADRPSSIILKRTIENLKNLRWWNT